MRECYLCKSVTFCKCSCDGYHICSDCYPSKENICSGCEEHCCELCYNKDDICDLIFVCRRCDITVCFNCVGICWCQCHECICKQCVRDYGVCCDW